MTKVVLATPSKNTVCVASFSVVLVTEPPDWTFTNDALSAKVPLALPATITWAPALATVRSATPPA